MRHALVLCVILLAIVVARPASAAPVIGAVTPINATANVAATLSATVSSGVSIERCTLWVDLAEIGDMTVSNGTASRSYTFASGGSRIAFVFCRDTQGGMAAGATTAITVSGQLIEETPLNNTQGGSGGGSSASPSTETEEEASAEASPYAGKLLKVMCLDGADMSHFCHAVYYIGEDNKRHAFPNSRVFFTWYSDFASVEEVDVGTLSTIPLGANVRYRAGVRMVKFTTDPKVYAVAHDGLLRWIRTEELARAYYGDAWNTQIDDMPDSFYSDYTFGEDITTTTDYNPEAELNNSRE